MPGAFSRFPRMCVGNTFQELSGYSLDYIKFSRTIGYSRPQLMKDCGLSFLYREKFDPNAESQLVILKPWSMKVIKLVNFHFN